MTHMCVSLMTAFLLMGNHKDDRFSFDRNDKDECNAIPEGLD